MKTKQGTTNNRGPKGVEFGEQMMQVEKVQDPRETETGL